MTPKKNVKDGRPASDKEPDEEPQTLTELSASIEPTNKKTRIVDTTAEHLGMSIAIIGGIRAPRD